MLQAALPHQELPNLQASGDTGNCSYEYIIDIRYMSLWTFRSRHSVACSSAAAMADTAN